MPADPAPSRFAHALVFYTSAVVLVLEILAGRLMAPFVGVSLETFTGIIGTILAGMATGSAVGGRLADARSPARLLGPTLVIGGALAALGVPIIAVLGPNVGSDPISIVLLAGLSFFAPAAALSAVSPMIAKIRLADLEETGKVVGSLSASGTAGALVGTFVTGFVLVSAIPSRPIVLGAGASLVVVGLYLSARLGSFPLGRNLALAALVVIGLSSLTPNNCTIESAYACIQIERDPARPTGRSLYLDGLRHSYVDLADPTHLEFRYFRLFADVLASLPEGPGSALHIGGAGFAFPRYVNEVRPGSDGYVLEIDDALVDVARDQLGLVTGPDLRLRVGDARTALPDLATDRYDLIVGDAFSGVSVPWHLTTIEVMAELQRALTPQGILMINVIDGGENRFARAELATLLEQFEHVALIAPAEDAHVANQVLIASDEPLPDIEVDPSDGELWTGREVFDYVGSARVLTDDFAPADQMTRNF